MEEVGENCGLIGTRKIYDVGHRCTEVSLLQAMDLKAGVHQCGRRNVALDNRRMVVGTYDARNTHPMDGVTETDPGFAWSQAMRQ
jgi:hypothetical protein